MSERENITRSTRTCPYCHSYDYGVNYVPFGGGLIVRTMCGKCGLKSQSMSDTLRFAFASEPQNVVSLFGWN
jgi:ribosomal protein S27AE